MSQSLIFGIQVNTTGATQALNAFGNQITQVGNGISTGFNAKLAESPVGKFMDKLKLATSSSSEFGKALGGGIVVGLQAVAVASATATVAITAFAIASADSANQIKRMSDATGVTTETISRFASMVSKGGGSVEDATDIMKDYADKLGDARNGNTDLSETFKKLGVDITKNNSTAFSQTIEGLGKMEDKSIAMNIGMKLFSDNYTKIAGQIANGNTLINQTPIMSDEFISKSEQMVSQFGILKTSFTTFGTQAVLPLVDQFGKLLTKLNDPSISGETPLKVMFDALTPSIGSFSKMLESLSPQDIQDFTIVASEALKLFLNTLGVFGIVANGVFTSVKATIQLAIEAIVGAVQYGNEIIATEIESLGTIIGVVNEEWGNKITATAKGFRESEASAKSFGKYVHEQFQQTVTDGAERQQILLDGINGINVTIAKTKDLGKGNDDLGNKVVNLGDKTNKLTEAQKKFTQELTESQNATKDLYSSFANFKANPFENIIEKWMGAESVIARGTVNLLAGFRTPWFKTSPFEGFKLTGGVITTAQAEYDVFINKAKSELDKLNKLKETLITSNKNVESTNDFKVLTNDIAKLTGVLEKAENAKSFLMNPSSFVVLSQAYTDSFNTMATGWLEQVLPSIQSMKYEGETFGASMTNGVNQTIDALLSLGNITKEQAESMKDLAAPMIDKMSTERTQNVSNQELQFMPEGNDKALKALEIKLIDQQDLLFTQLDQGLLTQMEYDNLLIDQEQWKQDQLLAIKMEGFDKFNQLSSLYATTATTMFSTISKTRYDKEMKSAEDAKNIAQGELASKRMTDKARLNEQKKIDDQYDKAKREAFQKTKGLKIAQVGMDTASAIMGAWSGAMQLPFPASVITGGILTAMMGVTGGIQANNIRKQEFADGGVVGGFNGASMGKDNRSATVRDGEMIFNARQQRNLFKAVDSGNVGGKGVSINIERFTGSDDELSRLEDMLYKLQSNNRFKFA